MKRPLGLHQLSAMDVSPVDLVDIAAHAGYRTVSLFTNAPVVPLGEQSSKFVFPTVTPDNKHEVMGRLATHGIDVLNAEFFLMRPDVGLASYRPGLALAQELGARNAVTHVFEPDANRAVDILGAFCEIAAAEELNVSLEFCPMTPGCKSIQQATWFVDQVGRSNLGFGICPLHLIRSGGTADDIANIDARYIFYGQLNDGHGLHQSSAYFDEVHDRQLPGSGDFPLQDILNALPADLPLEMKTPSDSRRAEGVSARDFTEDGYRRSRRLIDGLQPVR
ncbi:MAG: sugar phosphate isomerase/epimerase [Bacteroidales bacterium]|nr:sugar phosphate isomerase/epimerase [Bacteroidales bacterium]